MKVRFYNLSLLYYDCTELCRQVGTLSYLTDELCCIFKMVTNVAFPQAITHQLCAGWKVQREGKLPGVWPVLPSTQHPAFHISTFCFYLRAALHITWHNDQAPSHELSMSGLESVRIILCSNCCVWNCRQYSLLLKKSSLHIWEELVVFQHLGSNCKHD